MNEAELIAQLTLLPPLILGAIQMVKMAGVPSKFAPILAVGLGMGIAPFLTELPLIYELIGGAMVGLSASGLWEGGKAIGKAVEL